MSLKFNKRTSHKNNNNNNQTCNEIKSYSRWKTFNWFHFCLLMFCIIVSCMFLTIFDANQVPIRNNNGQNSCKKHEKFFWYCTCFTCSSFFNVLSSKWVSCDVKLLIVTIQLHTMIVDNCKRCSRMDCINTNDNKCDFRTLMAMPIDCVYHVMIVLSQITSLFDFMALLSGQYVGWALG